MSKPKVFVLGDSISMHYGPWLKAFISDKFSYGRKGEFEEWGDLNFGSKTNGGDSRLVFEYLQELTSQGFKTDYLLLNCGLHDLRTTPETGARQVPLAEYPDNLRKIIALCRENKFKIIWVRTTPLDEIIHNGLSQDMHRYEADLEAYNEVADAVMNECQVPMIDLYDFTVSLEEKLFCDHVHFNEPVRKLQAAYIAGYLKGMLADV